MRARQVLFLLCSPAPAHLILEPPLGPLPGSEGAPRASSCGSDGCGGRCSCSERCDLTPCPKCGQDLGVHSGCRSSGLSAQRPPYEQLLQAPKILDAAPRKWGDPWGRRGVLFPETRCPDRGPMAPPWVSGLVLSPSLSFPGKCHQAVSLTFHLSLSLGVISSGLTSTLTSVPFSGLLMQLLCLGPIFACFCCVLGRGGTPGIEPRSPPCKAGAFCPTQWLYLILHIIFPAE